MTMLVYVTKMHPHTTPTPVLRSVTNKLQVYAYMSKAMHIYFRYTMNGTLYWCYPGKPTSSPQPTQSTFTQLFNQLESYKVGKKGSLLESIKLKICQKT